MPLLCLIIRKFKWEIRLPALGKMLVSTTTNSTGKKHNQTISVQNSSNLWIVTCIISAYLQTVVSFTENASLW